MHNQPPDYALKTTAFNRDPQVAGLGGTKYGAAASRCGFGATVVGRSQAVRQRILIPPCEGSIPSAPANICQYRARCSMLTARLDHYALTYSRVRSRPVISRRTDGDLSLRISFQME